MVKSIYEFAIKKEVLNSGKVIYTPVCRKKSYWSKLFREDWERITKIYDRYFLLDLNFGRNPDEAPSLTYQDCKEHIEGFQESLLKEAERDIKCVEFHTLEEKTFLKTKNSN